MNTMTYAIAAVAPDGSLDIREHGLGAAEAYRKWQAYAKLCDEPHIIVTLISGDMKAGTRVIIQVFHDPAGLWQMPCDNGAYLEYVTAGD